MDRTEIEAKLNDLLVDELGIDREAIAPMPNSRRTSTSIRSA